MNLEHQRFLEQFALPSLAVSSEGSLVFANAAWRSAFGDSASDPWAWTRVVAEDDRERVRREVEHALATNRCIEVEFQAHSAHARALSLSVAFGPQRVDGFTGLLGVARDVSVTRRREQRLAFMAGHDPLTGLANRRAFEEALERASSLATTRDIPSVLLLLDMDNLKRFNDAFGHLQGDQALVNLALLLRTHIRASDLAARIGGDEFALLLSGATLSDADDIAQRICETTRGEFVAGARQTDLGVSGGIAAIESSVEPRVLMDRADAALYASKHGGRHRFVTWDSHLGELATSRGAADRVREALNCEHGVSLVFQPIVSLKDGSVSYYESLVRMNGEEVAQTLMPAEFLTTVERLGLMPRLTLRVLDLALAALAENPGVALSINLSTADITDAKLLDDIEASIIAAGIDPTAVLFEITENTLLANLVEGRAWIERLARLGCRFVLDEFGTGLGVFVLLGEAHIEQVKLARAIIDALEFSQESRAFVRSVRELIESQGKLTVAAFIETEAILGDVVEAGFEYSQGYALCEPSAGLAGLIEHMEQTRHLR